MKKIILPFIIFGALLACKKVELDNHDNYIRARVELRDTVDGQPVSSSTKNFICKLYSNNSDTTDYLYSTVTNEQGYLIFDVPANVARDEYFVMVSGTVSGEAYTSKLESFKKEDNVFPERIIRMTQNITERTYGVLSAMDTTGQVLPGTQFFLYNNTLVAASSFSTDAVYKATADMNGQARIKDLSAGTYYINALADYGNGLVFKAKALPVTFVKGNLQKESVIMHKQ